MTSSRLDGAWRGQFIGPRLDPFLGPPAPRDISAWADRRYLFRRQVHLARVPEAATYRIFADSRYVLYVNGQEVQRGPARHGRGVAYYDHGDLAGYLAAGENVLAVLVRFYGFPVAAWEPAPVTVTHGRGSLVAEFDFDGRLLATDEEWRCLPSLAWTPGRPHGPIAPHVPEILDARKLDERWTETGFDDSQWPSAMAQPDLGLAGTGASTPPNAAFGAMRPRPTLIAEERRTAASAAALPAARRGEHDRDVWAYLEQLIDPGSAPVPHRFPLQAAATGAISVFCVDFGRIVFGHVELSLDGTAGTVVTGALVQTMDRFAHALSDAAAFRYVLRGHGDHFKAQDPAGGRYLVLAVDGPATIRDAAVAERLRPRRPGPQFECDDPALTLLWQTAVQTVDLCAADAYLDCPTREQRAFTGDAVVHTAVDLVANPDWSMPVHNIELLAQPRADGLLPAVVAGDWAAPDRAPIADWSLHWVHSLYLIYRYTGDTGLVGRLLPVAERIVRWFASLAGEDGLAADVPAWVLIDWSPVRVAGTSAALNALWGRGLREFAAMAEWLGDTGRAAWARQTLAALADGFEVFWDDARGAYRDHRVGGRVMPAVSEHTNAAAVCAGLVPAARRDRVRDLLLDRGSMFHRAPGFLLGKPFGAPEPDEGSGDAVVAAQPFFRYVVHDALAELGAGGEIARLCRDWLPMLDSGGGALREVWEGGSFCHGWSAVPARDLIVYVAGISPGSPGFGRARIMPRPGCLKSFTATAPTPHGPVTVAVDGELVTIDSPVPVTFAGYTGRPAELPPGTSQVSLVDPAHLSQE